MIYINKTRNKITFKIKKGYYLELSMPETKELLASTRNKITKDENGDNVPHLEITEVILVHCKIAQQQLSAKFISLIYICSK